MSSKEQVIRTPNGQFLPGHTGNPKGRPRGSRNASTELREAFDGSASLVAKTVIEAAIDGDIQAAKLVVERLQPPIRARAEHVEFELPENASLSEKADALLTACSEGKIAPDVTASLITALGNQARLIEISQFEKRLEELEAAADGNH